MIRKYGAAGSGRVWLFVPLAVFALVAIFLWAGIGNDPTVLPSARIGKPFPTFSLEPLKQSPEGLLDNEALMGEPALVNVWATWCPSCQVEHPYLVHLAEQARVRIIGLNYKDEREKAIDWLSRLGDPYEFSLFDPDGSLGFDLGVYGAPETYVIDGQGVVRYRHVGVVDERLWQETLEPLMASLSDNPNSVE